MLSRVADALYWLGRYVERAENITRLLLVTEDFSTEVQGLAEDLAQAEWKDLLAILPGSQVTRSFPNYAPLAIPYLYAFYLDEANPYSIRFSLKKARDNARAVREALTVEVFVSLNETYRELEAHAKKDLSNMPSYRTALAATQKGILSVVGAVDSTLARDEGWQFLKLGEALERIYRTTGILRTKLPALGTPDSAADLPLYYTRWRTLLRGVSSLENYRRSHGATLEPHLVTRFILFDPNMPRSLRSGTARVRQCLERIAGDDTVTAPARAIGKLHGELVYDEADLMRRGDLVPFLDHVHDAIAKTHDALAAQYFVT
jgi:uncharacterized alpha-E superfamily protein